MITCSQCNTLNSPDRLVCEKCNADLLPMPKASKRKWAIIRAVLLGLFIIFIGLAPFLSFLHEPDMGFCSGVAVLVMLIGGVVLLRGVLRAVKPPEIYARYLDRAALYAQSGNDQAIADFVHGVMLAPAKIRQNLSRRLPKKLKNEIYPVGNIPVFSSPGDTSPEAIKKTVYAAYINWAALSELIPEFVNATEMGFEAGWESVKQREKRDKWLEGMGKILGTLAEAELVRKLGYCPKCKAVVEWDKSGYCTTDKKHGVPLGRVYVIPDEIELISKRLQQIYE
jgi:hypothetical protein